MKGRSQADIIADIQIIKKKINIVSTELENFVKYLDQNVFKKGGFGFCGPSKASALPQFVRAFNTLNTYEKADYYLTCLRLIQDLNKKKEAGKGQFREQQRYQVMFRDDRKSKDWRLTFIIINFQKVTIFYGFTGETINLQNYLIRSSKCKDRPAFALQAISRQVTPLTLRLSISNLLQFQQIKSKIRGLILIGLRNKLFNMMGFGKQKVSLGKNQMKIRQSVSVQITEVESKKSLRELLRDNSSGIDFTMEEYNKIASTLINEELISGLDSFDDYQQIRKGVYFHSHKFRVKKVYVFQKLEQNVEWFAQQFFEFNKFKIWKSSLFIVSLLADITNQKTKIFHQINMYKDSSECDFVYLRHLFKLGNIVYFIDKSISTIEYGSHQTSNSRGKIDYCLWRIRTNQKGNIQIVIEAEMSHIPTVDQYEAISQQIGEVQNIIYNKKGMFKNSQQLFVSASLSLISSYNKDFQFTSYEGISPNHNKLDDSASEFYSIRTPADGHQMQQNILWQFETGTQKEQNIKSYHYSLQPILTKQKQLREYKGKICFDADECVVNQKGEILFVNQDKIKAQSSVLKNVLKRIGTNLISGKSILNISLPIQIFGTDTNIERLCKSMSYGPHFLQNLTQAAPIQRMKRAICFSVGNILLYLEMTKPFNPVLGETYQGFIDGCPIYGEQTSHHPPISSLFFVGRGYFVTASLQAKVQFGMNSVSGINQGRYNIAFHKKDPTQNVISFTGPPGELAGVIYGERKLTLIKKTRFYDSVSQLYCEISWGKGKGKTGLQTFCDYMEGKIVKLKNPHSNFDKLKEGKDDEVLGKIYGRWTEKIYFNDQIIFDVNTLRSFKPTNEKRPLASDSFFRKDLRILKEGNVALAQLAKQQIQEVQRRDRKLRKQYRK